MNERIDGAHVVLQRWRPSHLEALQQIVASSLGHIATFMSSAASEVADPSSFLTLVDAAWNAGVTYAYAIEENNRVVGHITFAPSEHGGEIGYWVRLEDVGRGIATDAVRSLAASVFATAADVTSLRAGCNAGNLASRHVLENAGFHLASQRDWNPRTPDEADRELEFVLERF